MEANAINKAKLYSNRAGIQALVEESGLEISALNNENSKRWLGSGTEDEQLIKEIMDKMAGQSDRACRLNLVVALSTPFGIMTSDASIEGVVAEKASSKKIDGHPYRSLMYFPRYEKYYCDLTEKEHEILNHRKHAIDKIKDMFVEIAK